MALLVHHTHPGNRPSVCGCQPVTRGNPRVTDRKLRIRKITRRAFKRARCRSGTHRVPSEEFALAASGQTPTIHVADWVPGLALFLGDAALSSFCFVFVITDYCRLYPALRLRTELLYSFVAAVRSSISFKFRARARLWPEFTGKKILFGCSLRTHCYSAPVTGVHYHCITCN